MNLQMLLQFKAESLEDGASIRQAIIDMLVDHGVEVHSAGTVQVAPSEIVIHTDGGCDRNKGGVGAWAYTVHHPDGTYDEQCGAEMETTNNRMEMTAVLKALEAMEIGVPIRVVADSEYVIKGITVWSRNWVRNGWRTASGSQVINKDLWEPLLKLYQLHDVKFEWVKGHTGAEFNERCDTLCTEAMAALHKKVLMEAPPISPDTVAPL